MKSANVSKSIGTIVVPTFRDEPLRMALLKMDESLATKKQQDDPFLEFSMDSSRLNRLRCADDDGSTRYIQRNETKEKKTRLSTEVCVDALIGADIFSIHDDDDLRVPVGQARDIVDLLHGLSRQRKSTSVKNLSTNKSHGDRAVQAHSMVADMKLNTQSARMA